MNTLFCGHPIASASTGDERTSYCMECEEMGREKSLPKVWPCEHYRKQKDTNDNNMDEWLSNGTMIVNLLAPISYCPFCGVKRPAPVNEWCEHLEARFSKTYGRIRWFFRMSNSTECIADDFVICPICKKEKPVGG